MDDNTIDRLVIEVEVNSKGAESKMDSLKKKMSDVKNNAQQMGDGASQSGNKFSELGKKLKQTEGFGGKLGKALSGKLGNGLSAFTGKIKGLLNMIGKMALRMAIRGMIKAVINGFKEGIQNVYKWSDQMGGRVSASLDKISTAMSYLKNSIGAAASPLINAIAPAIDTIVDKLVNMINLINQFFAKVTGASTWTKAIKGQTKFAESTAKGAKALKSFTLGFDELNVLEDKASGGGAGGNSGASGLFEEVKLDSSFATWVDDIKNTVANGDWAGVGSIIAEKLNTAIDKIDSVGIGKKIGSTINKGVAVANGFLTSFDFKNLGTKVGELTATAIDETDFSQIGTAVVNAINGGLDFASGLLDKVDGNVIGTAAGEWVSGTPFAETTTKIFEVIKKIFAFIPDAISSFSKTTDWEFVGREIVDAIANAIIAICDGEWWLNLFKSIFEGIGGIGEGIGKALWGAIDEAGILINGEDVWGTSRDKLIEKGEELLDKLDTTWGNIKNTVTKKWDEISTAWGNFADYVTNEDGSINWENLGEVVGNAFSDVSVAFDKWRTQAGKDLETFFTETLPKWFTEDLPRIFKEDLPNAVNSVFSWLKYQGARLRLQIKIIGNNVKQWFVDAWDNVVNGGMVSIRILTTFSMVL